MKVSQLIFESYIQSINFPKNEHKHLISELKKGKTFTTTRVSNDYGKFKKGKIYKAPWGDNLKVIDSIKFTNIEQHPFYNDPEFQQFKKELIGYKKYEVLKLQEV